MKKIFLFPIAFAVIFSACKKKGVDDTPPPATGFTWPAGTSDYAPTTINSTFTYEITTGTPAVIDSFTYKVTKDTTIAGAKYYKLVSNKDTLAPTYFSNYNAGVITNINYNLNFQGQITLPEFKQTIIKDNVPLNATWNESPPVSYLGFPINVLLVYTILQKDFTKTVLAKDYANTITVKQVINISLPGGFPLPAGIPASTQIDNYFAKGVGLIQKDLTGSTQKIKRFNIVK